MPNTISSAAHRSAVRCGPPTGLIERRIEADGWPIYFRLGAAAGRDVLLLHGIPGSGRSWDPLLENLPSQLRPIVPDLLGFGLSGRPSSVRDFHAAGQAERLEQALDLLAVDRPILVGHDFGGPVALRLVMRQPDRYAGLVLSATNAFGDTPIPFPLALVNAPLVGGPTGVAARLLFSGPALAGMCRVGARRGRVDARLALGDAAQQATIRRIFAESLTHLPGLYGEIERALPTLRSPTLVVWGDHDPFFPLAQGRRLADAIPGARLAVLAGCGHFLPEEAPREYAQLLAL